MGRIASRLRALGMSASAVLVASLLLVISPTAAHAAPGVGAGLELADSSSGNITGTVTAEATGLPLEYVFVTLTEVDSGETFWAMTGPDGRYTFDPGPEPGGIAPGTYRVRFDFGPDTGYHPYATQYWPAAVREEAGVVTVAAAQVVEGVDAALLSAASISGKVIGSGDAVLVWGARPERRQP